MSIENSLVSAIFHMENWAYLNKKLLKPPHCSRSQTTVRAVFLVWILHWVLVCEDTAYEGPQPAGSMLIPP